MVPNVYGMSQFADGGTFTTKPYLSGSNDILKMSDERKGPWCGFVRMQGLRHRPIQCLILGTC